MKELNLIYEVSRSLECLGAYKSAIREVILETNAFDMIVNKLSRHVMHTEALKRHVPNDYFIYCGITFLKEKN